MKSAPPCKDTRVSVKIERLHIVKRLTAQILLKIYQRLHEAFGPQYWWPAKTRFEVIVGAILTQNTNWGNVEKALDNLKAKKLLSCCALHHLPHEQLVALIRPAGYFNVKAKRLKNFTHFLFKEYNGDLKKMGRQPLEVLRHQLLGVNGIGPETADSILLYAFEKPIFVVDAYTKRMLYRHNLVAKDADYHQIQDLFTHCFDSDTAFFNEYHALIVRLGKEFCRPKPLCEACVLNNVCYSLLFKCPHCHRALKGEEEKSYFKKRGRCLECVG